MIKKIVLWGLGILTTLIVSALLIGAFFIFPPVGASLLLSPHKKAVVGDLPEGAQEFSLMNGDVELKGWTFKAEGAFKGTIIYLHGIADNRGGVIGVAQQFVSKGYDVRGYDSRAHGESGGRHCTYGYYEKEDLKALIKDCRPGPIVLIGSSMGGAVATQAAPEIKELEALILLDTFSDLSVIIRDRVPSAIPNIVLDRAKRHAEKMGEFKIDEVSPRTAVEKIKVPTLLIHGGADKATPPEHSQKIFENLRSVKKLLIIEGAGHCASGSRPETWRAITDWIQAHAG